MTRQEQLNNWLGNRQRTYADGLILFKSLAKVSMIEKFGAYLDKCPENPHIFDPHFTQLINSLTKIEREIKEAPSLYPAAMEEIIVVKTLSDEERKEALQERLSTIKESQEIIEDLKERISILESDTEGHSDELISLQDQFKEKMAEMSTLRSEVDTLQMPGIKIITEESLTPAIRKAYSRIKEIVPLYASLHNDIANPDIPEEERKSLAEELCKLDDERRRLWKQIDDWSEGKGNLELIEKRPVFSDNSIVRGFEIARQIKRLKQNIINSKSAAERAEKEGKKVVMQNALDRINAYNAELKMLEDEITAKQGETVSG